LQHIFQAFYSALPIAVYVLFSPFSVHSFAFSLFPMYQGLVYLYSRDLIHTKQWKKRKTRGEIDILAPIFTIDLSTWLHQQTKFPRGGVNMAVALPVFYSSAKLEFKKNCLPIIKTKEKTKKT
jgi:hypothetical protein